MVFKQQHKKTMLRFIAFAMALCMLSSVFLERAASAASSPEDIRGGWSEGILLEWMAKGWLNGYPDGTVKPAKEVTRAEFFTLANKSLGYVNEAGISFIDVEPETWIAKQVAIALQAGYVEGYPDGTIQPDRGVTREEVSVMVAKAFGLKLSPEETSMFTDAASITNTGNGAVGALVAGGVLKGYPDGSFRPNKVITREEAVVILDGALKKLERKDETRNFDASGTYGPTTGVETVSGNAVIASSGVTLRNMEIQGDLLLAAGIGEGEATLDNVKVKGTVTVNGGGPNSIYLIDTELNTLVVDKKNGNIRIVVKDSTFVKRVDLLSGAWLVYEAAKDKGFGAIQLTKEMPAGSKLILQGEFAEVNVAASNVEIELIKGWIQRFNVLPGASGDKMKLEKDTRIVDLTLDDKVTVQGQGVIDRAVIAEQGKESKFERLPGKLEGKGAPSPSPGTVGGGGGGGGNNGNRDTTPPAAPIVTGVQNGQVYAGPVTPDWSDASGTTSIATLTKEGSGNVIYTRNSKIAEDGSYILNVTAKKNSNGKTTTTTIHFTIDSAPPAAPTIEGIADGGRYFSALPDWTDATGTVSTAMLSKDGHEAAPYERGTLIEEEGDYVLTVTATKTSNGLTAATTIRFAIDEDNAAPALIAGVEEGGSYSSAIITWTDAPDMDSIATLAKDGGAAAPFTSGTEITEEGDYVLTVMTQNVLSSRTVEQQIRFSINSGPPQPVEINITGEYNSVSDSYRSAKLHWMDPVGTISSAMLKKDNADPIPYEKEELIDQDGDYVLTVTSTKLSNGLTATATKAFKVATLVQTPIVTGFADKGIYFAPVTMSWEPSPGTTIIGNSLKNVGTGEVRNDIPNPTTLTEDGTYYFRVLAEKNGEEIPFGFDFIITGIRGVEDGQSYESVTPTWVEPLGFGSVSGSEATLIRNGEPAEPFVKGTTIDEPGEYQLTVIWRTGPNNSASQSVQFDIDSELPEPVEVTGVENGGTYMSATATWTDASGMTSTATLAKDGEEAKSYASGTEITEDGNYVLKLTTRRDSNGSQVHQEISFTIDTVPPGEATIVIGGNSRVLSGVMAYYLASLSWTEPTGTTSTAMLRKDGAELVLYTMGALIDQDGDYELIVTTTKLSNGLTSTATRLFNVTTGPAQPTLSGFSDNAILFSPLEMAWTIGEGTTFDWVRLFNMNTRESIDSPSSPMTLEQSGEYEFSVGVRKGTEIEDYYYSFIVAGISGVEDKGVYYDSVTPDWFVPETLGEVEATLKKGSAPAETYTKGTPITEPDNYILTVTWSMGDNKDITASKSVSFRVVNSLRITINGNSRAIDGVYHYYNAMIDWTEPAGKSGTAMLKIGDAAPIPWPKRGLVEHDGDYEAIVTWTDMTTGETTTDSLAFKVHSGAASPIVSGIKNEEIYSRPVIFNWTPFEKTTVESVTLTRRDTGEAIATNPSERLVIDQEGEYEFKVKVRREGETREYTYRFALAWVRGVESYEQHISVTPNWFKPNVFTINRMTLQKDGQYITTYKRGDTISEKGSYILEVTWRINDTTRGELIRFEVDPDFHEPIEVTGIEPYGTYESAAATWTNNNDVYAYAWIVGGNHPDPKRVYDKGTLITEEGNYSLLVYTYNTTSSKASVLRIINFTIVSGPPAPVTVTGVVYGGSYPSASPTWDDAAGLTITAALSKDGGAPDSYEKGTPITEPGSYVLAVTASKENGQTAVTEISFTIVGEGPEKPTIVLNGVPNGSNYYSVTPNWTDAEGTTSTATLTRTWDEEEPVTSSFESGTLIEEEGDYVLTVTTTNTSNGLTATTTVTFTVTTQVP